MTRLRPKTAVAGHLIPQDYMNAYYVVSVYEIYLLPKNEWAVMR